MKPNVELHIEELVLQGFGPLHRGDLDAAVERELLRLFAERSDIRGRDSNDGLHRLRSTAVIQGGISAESIGAPIARSLFKAVMK